MFWQHCSCGERYPLPPASTDRCNGRPVRTASQVCPACGAETLLQDFGNCNGLRRVKGFALILAEQKRQVAQTRKAIRAYLAPLERPILKALKRLTWSAPARRPLQEELSVVRRQAVKFWLLSS